MLLYVDLAKARRHLGGPGQMSLFGPTGMRPSAPAAGQSSHVEVVPVKGHTRHTEHGPVDVAPHTRLVVKVDPPKPSARPPAPAVEAPAPEPTPEPEPPPRRTRPMPEEVLQAEATRYAAEKAHYLAEAIADHYPSPRTRRLLQEADEAHTEAHAEFWRAVDRNYIGQDTALRLQQDAPHPEGVPPAPPWWVGDGPSAEVPITPADTSTPKRRRGAVPLNLATAGNVEHLDASDRSVLVQIFGRDVSTAELVGMIGLEQEHVDGANIQIIAFGRTITVNVTKQGAFTIDRSFSLDREGRKHCHNALFTVHSSLQGEGLALSVFSRQVKQLQREGFHEISVYAAGRAPIERGAFCGFYTWPRFGYDGAIPIPADRRPPEYANATRMSQIMATEAGRTWWRDVAGTGVDLSFSLAAGSKNVRALKRYAKAKEIQRAAAAKREPEPTE